MTGSEILLQARSETPPVRAHAHPVDAAAVAVKHELADLDMLREQCAARADEHGVGAGIGLEHVQGAGPADAYAAALADGEGVSALVLAQDPSLTIDDRARSRPQAAVALQEGALARAGEEAQVLGVLAVCDREAGALCDLAHARLVQPAERKAKARERRGRERGEHVALVLALVGGETQQPVGLHARVVTGRERARAEPRGELEHRVGADAAGAA